MRPGRSRLLFDHATSPGPGRLRSLARAAKIEALNELQKIHRSVRTELRGRLGLFDQGRVLLHDTIHRSAVKLSKSVWHCGSTKARHRAAMRVKYQSCMMLSGGSAAGIATRICTGSLRLRWPIAMILQHFKPGPRRTAANTLPGTVVKPLGSYLTDQAKTLRLIQSTLVSADPSRSAPST